MGWVGAAFGVAGGIARGATAATMWTGNAIYTGIQNARTKKEIRALYQHAADANFQNRAVTVAEGIGKQQLLLTTGQPDDNDVYDYPSAEDALALNYIWGVTDEPNSVVISGGRNRDRVLALLPFIYKAQEKGLPVFVLHTGNRELEQMVTKYSVDHEFISDRSTSYDVFRGMPEDDIAYLLYETMPKDNATPAAESLMRALVEVLLRTEGHITLTNLAAYPIINLKNKIDALYKSNALTTDEYDDINRYYMAGSSETDSVRIFLNRLSRQAESVFGKVGTKPCNIKRMLNQKGVIAIETGLSANDLLLSLVINHLLLIQSQKQPFAVVVDSIPVSKYSTLRDLMRGHPYAISNQDFVSSLYGGDNQGQDLFAELTGNVATTVLFRHASGTSCQRWSDHLGKYRKIRIRYNLSQSNAFMNSSNSWGLSVDETDEPRIRAETIGKLPDGMACIHSIDGILIAEVKDIQDSDK